VIGMAMASFLGSRSFPPEASSAQRRSNFSESRNGRLRKDKTSPEGIFFQARLRADFACWPVCFLTAPGTLSDGGQLANMTKDISMLVWFCYKPALRGKRGVIRTGLGRGDEEPNPRPCLSAYGFPPDQLALPKSGRRGARVATQAGHGVASGGSWQRASDWVKLGLPWGTKPRLILAHLNAEALRQGSPEIEIEASLSAFVRRIRGFDGGREIRAFKDQLSRLSVATVRMAAAHEDYNDAIESARTLAIGISTAAAASAATVICSRVTASSAPSTTLVAIVGEVFKQVLDEHDLPGGVEPACD
jgi:hypothetical protein